MPKKTTAAKAAKKAKALQKVEKKETKDALKEKGKSKSKSKKGNDSDSDGDDLEGILEKMRKEWELAHTVTEELVEGPPSRRANATLTACPNGNHLWCIGGEFFGEDGKAYFYNDTFRYTPEKDEWRKFISPTCPGPRSAHAVVASPGGGGKLFLFGGEFSSLHQNSFHHYRDFWCFDISTHSWERIDTKVRPTARSGHRMAVWKHLIILFGGFYDPGITTRYLNDLWVFDTQEYKWTLIEMKLTDSRPSPRSGFSFLPCADGIVLHGGYCKEYAKGKRPVGIMLEDTWLLKITEETPPTPSTSTKTPTTSTKSKPSTSKNSFSMPTFKWEKRKRPSDAYAPCLRSGCTMTLWAAKSMGILFGGVTDEDTSEERLDSVFWNDLYGYNLNGKGKWISMTLKKPKAKGGKGQAKKQVKKKDKWDSDDEGDPLTEQGAGGPVSLPPASADKDIGVEDPLLTVPMPRYNTMLAVLKNTLYIYGGIIEKGSREYTLDDFHALQLDKMERFICLKKPEVVIPEGEQESSSDEDEDEDDDDETEDEEDEYDDDDDIETLVGADETSEFKLGEDMATIYDEPEVIKKVGAVLDYLSLADENFLDKQDEKPSVDPSKDGQERPAEDAKNTPLPGETLAMFYARCRDYWTQEAMGSDDLDRKQLRRVAFSLAKERYDEYKPMQKEIEKILEEAGLDEEEMRRGAAAGPTNTSGTSRNRR
ncbi:Kelch repeat-containing protein 3 [Psilocybe cubensis]|uniref:Kelch repeat-containing protein 3 n=2 Tax=Psilocybe cubensis TaxID=181762 RepID=A0ACB8H6G6_PSICU|nr:Kelch repeat-containing protein 3 [Psilocybe cubensis]KAH9483277.1 Kelch repeat-containing protein 3 [Psilocybe cubensis]